MSERRLNKGDIVCIEKPWSPEWHGVVAIVTQGGNVPWFELLYPVVTWDSNSFNLGTTWHKHVAVLGNIKNARTAR